MTRSEWLAARQLGVGSSDAPNLISVGFRSAADVYREKTEPPVDELPKTGVLRRGIDLEELVARKYAEEMGVEVTAGELAVVVHPRRFWQTASIDRFRQNTRPLEIKTTLGFGDGWGDPGTDQIPDGYRVQVQHQMGVLGADTIDVAALDIMEWSLRVYRVAFNPDLFGWLTEVEERFYRDHMVARVPPGPEWGRDFLPAGLALHLEKNKRLDLGDTAAWLCSRREQFGTVIKEAEAERDLITEQLKELMGDAEAATAGQYKLKQTLITGATVSYERKPYLRLDVRGPKKREGE